MAGNHGILLVAAALGAVIALIVLITACKLNPFIAMFIASVGVAVVTGMPPRAVVQSFEVGLGNTLGHVAIVIALGTMLGKMMAESGGADCIAQTLIRRFGKQHIPWAMLFIGLLVGLPVFFEVGFVVLMPIAFTVAARTRTSLVLVGLPMVAGLSVVHGLVPPHPAAILAVTIYKADVGRTIFYSLLVAVPSAALAGPIYAKFIAPRTQLLAPDSMALQFVDHGAERSLPSFGLAVFTILLPVILMLAGSWADAVVRRGSFINDGLHLIGNDDIALLVGVLFSFVSFGKMRGFTRETILRFSNECLAPTAAITLLVGGGGGFGRILQDSGVSQALIDVALHRHLPLIVLAWILAAMIRLAVVSATAAMATAAAIVAPIAMHSPGLHPELMAIATGAGSLFFSHVNDGGFWLVKEYFNMSVPQTMKSWSICETIISVTALVLTLAISFVV